MAAKKQATKQADIVTELPRDLKDHPFFGLRLDEEQEVFRDLIWNGSRRLIFCASRAGTGKTTIAVATAVLLVKYNQYNRIIYVNSAGNNEKKLGYLPGDVGQKSSLYAVPCAQALLKIGENPSRVMSYDSPFMDTPSDAFVYATTDAYARGVNFGTEDDKTIVIIEEAQNYTPMQLKTILTRVNDAGLTVVIGDTEQCDIGKNSSGFDRMIRHFSGSNLASYCELKTCHRGKIAEWAENFST